MPYKKRSGEFEAKVDDRKKKLVVKRGVFLTKNGADGESRGINFMWW